MTAIALDHIQIAMPQGGETAARRFFGQLLAMTEIAKPDALAGRGGLWFVLDDGIGFHLGVEADFRPANKAHAGLRLATFETVLARLEQAEVAVERGLDTFGRRRAYLNEPFGNRLELIDGA